MALNIKKIIPGAPGVYEFVTTPFRLPRLISDFIALRRSARSTAVRFPLQVSNFYLRLLDRTTVTPFDPHYVYHPAWAARVLAATKPTKHIDIASILSFPTIVSAFIPVEYYDYRPANLKLRQLTSTPGDLHNLPFADESVWSLSCMHTIEHVGLGRYGDPIDYDGDIKACRELARVLAPSGNLLFVTPVGKPRIEFNAHRVYSYDQVLALFPTLTLKEFSMVPDVYQTSGLIENADPSLVESQQYACGCFWFTA